MDEIRVPIYLITGFLESGKTTFLRFTPGSGLFPDRMEKHFLYLWKREKRNTIQKPLRKIIQW